MATLVGQSLRRKEDYRMVTGTGMFVADIKKPGMVEATFVRSTHAHAKIKNIDVGRQRRWKACTQSTPERIW